MKFEGVSSRLYGGSTNQKRKRVFYYDVQITVSDWCPLKKSILDKNPLFKADLETNLLYAWLCSYDEGDAPREEARRWSAICRDVSKPSTNKYIGMYPTSTSTNFIYGKIRYSHNVITLDKFMKWKRIHAFV